LPFLIVELNLRLDFLVFGTGTVSIEVD